MSLKEALLHHMQDFIDGKFTWGGRMFTTLPGRDAVTYQMRITLTEGLHAATKSLDETGGDEAVAVAFSALYIKFELNVLTKNCSSSSLETMQKLIAAELKSYSHDEQERADVTATAGEADHKSQADMQQHVSLVTKPEGELHGDEALTSTLGHTKEGVENDYFSVEVSVSDSTNDEDRAVLEHSAAFDDENELALVAVEQPENTSRLTLWDCYRRHQDYCSGLEVMPKLGGKVSAMWHDYARQSSLFTRNQMLSVQGVRTFESMDYFQRLGVGHSASSADIRHAYLKLMRHFHPDRLSSEPQKAEKAGQITQMLNQAYGVLVDDAQRARYTAKVMCDDITLSLTGESMPACFGLLNLWPSWQPGFIGPAGIMFMAVKAQATGIWTAFKSEVRQGVEELGQIVDELEQDLNQARYQ